MTSIYLCVVAMLRCPAKLASTRTPTPLLANVVINERLLTWLKAKCGLDAALTVEAEEGGRVVVEKERTGAFGSLEICMRSPEG